MNTIACKRLSTLAVLAATCLATLTPAADAAMPLGFPWLRDVQVTIYARRALMDDPALARLNLGVNVREGVATVWGPIPDAEAGRKALKRIEEVKGVLQVRSDLYFLGPKKEDELLDLPFVFEAPTRTESASPDRESGQIVNLAGRVNPGFPIEPLTTGLHLAISLLPPVAITDEPKSPAVAAPPSRQQLVTTSIDSLRRTNERFRPIATELKDGTVSIRAGTAQGENVMAFAQAIAQLPGVERVVVLNQQP